MLETIARDNKVPVLFVNQVGGNDSLIFDGSSMVIAPDGRIVAQAKSFEEDLIVFDSETMQGDMHEQIASRVTPALMPRWCWARAIMCANAASARW